VEAAAVPCERAAFVDFEGPASIREIVAEARPLADGEADRERISATSRSRARFIGVRDRTPPQLSASAASKKPKRLETKRNRASHRAP